jgi:hypothetical protein
MRFATVVCMSQCGSPEQVNTIKCYILLNKGCEMMGARPWHNYPDRVLEKQWRLERVLKLAWVPSNKEWTESILL